MGANASTVDDAPQLPQLTLGEQRPEEIEKTAIEETDGDYENIGYLQTAIAPDEIPPPPPPLNIPEPIAQKSSQRGASSKARHAPHSSITPPAKIAQTPTRRPPTPIPPAIKPPSAQHFKPTRLAHPPPVKAEPQPATPPPNVQHARSHIVYQPGAKPRVATPIPKPRPPIAYKPAVPPSKLHNPQAQQAGVRMPQRSTYATGTPAAAGAQPASEYAFKATPAQGTPRPKTPTRPLATTHKVTPQPSSPAVATARSTHTSPTPSPSKSIVKTALIVRPPKDQKAVVSAWNRNYDTLLPLPPSSEVFSKHVTATRTK
ncbi:unnamed protein product [Heligmosomoides polygyrus]|uniref:Extensin-like n=1 Tax=Heligmosomoides polygyrus TaxID=6339 RepID=A0A183FWG7_HELPZ|nr:unnamed protein product [Heligmosomoides polygyrus]